MMTADEIQEMLKEKKAAEKLLKKYGEARKHVSAMEKYRQSLLGVIGATIGKYKWDDYERYRLRMAEIIVPQEDRQLLEEYIDGLEIINTVEVAIRERMKTNRREEAVAMFVEQRSFRDVIDNYNVSERTIRRLWKKGLEAIDKEIALRIGCGRSVSNDIF